MLRRELLIQGVALVVLGGLAGFVGGKLSNHTALQAQAKVANVASQKQQTHVAGHVTLSPAPASVVKAIYTIKVHDANGKLVSMPTNRPVFFVAYWCPYCHNALSLLEKNNLLNKVQVVGVWFDRSASPSGEKPVTTVAEATTLMQEGFTQAKVSLSPNSVLYALPSEGLDNAVNAIPLLLVKKNGQWMELKGYTPDVSSWVDALAGQL